MDMMYMPDALNAAVMLMEADPAKLIHRNAFNIASMSFDPESNISIYQDCMYPSLKWCMMWIL